MAWTRVRLGRDTRKGGLLIIESEEVAADQDKLYTVGSGEKVEVLAIRVELTTGVGVADRAPIITVQDAAANDVRLILGSDTVTAASTTRSYNFVKGGEGSLVPPTSGNEVVEQLPEDFILGAGEDLRFTLDNVQADETVVIHMTLRVF
jgi:hypothetical protein